jgi:hypothetical protein
MWETTNLNQLQSPGAPSIAFLAMGGKPRTSIGIRIISREQCRVPHIWRSVIAPNVENLKM